MITLNDILNVKQRSQESKEQDIIENLTRRQQEKIKNINQIYENIYEDCLNQINKTSKTNNTMTVYFLPKNILKTYDYNYRDCADYIKKKLEKFKIDCLLVKNNLIISWKNI